MSDSFREYQVSVEECNRALSHAGLPPATVVTRIPRGEVNAVFTVTLADERRVILKVQLRPGRPAAHLLREREACDRLRRVTRIPVPEVLALDTTRELLPYGYSVLSYLEGEDAADVFPRLGSEGQRRLFRALGGTLAEIHAVPLPEEETALPVRRSAEEWDEAQERAFETAVAWHAGRVFLPAWLLREAEARWAEGTAGGPELCLLHGDFQPSNVRVSRRHFITGVCDFDQTDIGRAEFDLAALEMWLPEGRADLREAMYEGYAEVRPVTPALQEGVQRNMLLRHLQSMVAYEGPVRGPHGGGSSAEAIARAVVGAARPLAFTPPPVAATVRRPARAAPSDPVVDPADLNAVTGGYLATILARGLGERVEVDYWHCVEEPSWQGFPGREARTMLLYISARPAGAVWLVLKITPSVQEAMFYTTLARHLPRNVPAVYHVAVRPEGKEQWLFLEHIPCMVLGPLWEGREFEKALEGLAAIHAAFWQEAHLSGLTWLPQCTERGVLGQFQRDMEALARPAGGPGLPRQVRSAVADLVAAVGDADPAAAARAAALVAPPFTLLHGDYHLANVGTRDRSLEAAVVVADWSNCAIGPPQVDLVYLLSAIEGMTRQRPAREWLVQRYLELLQAADIAPEPKRFRAGLQAATFFSDITHLAGLLQEWEFHTSWRDEHVWSAEREVAVRADRARQVARSQ
jgi:aminoglycoside phosphotransferase (APT) family kinase protein